MASALMFATRSTVGQQPDMRRLAEKAGQTFLAGTPVEVEAASGGIIPWDGTTIAGVIAGICKEAASNLTSTGVPKTLTYGIVQNQPNAVNIPEGAPINDGRIAVEVAVNESVFFGQVGPSQTTAVTDVGAQYGMTKDSDNHWYVDKTKATAGTNTVVKVVKLDPFDTTRGVQFIFLPAAQQLVV